MNIRGIDMKKLKAAAERAGISEQELAKGLQQNKGKVARMAGRYASGGRE